MSRWVDDLQVAAEHLLPEVVAAYYRQGAGDGLSAAEAAQGWRDVRLRPRVLRDVSRVTTATTLLGTPVPWPIAIAPTSLQRYAADAGEAAMAVGVAATDTLLVVSSNAGSTFTSVAAAGAPWWVQVYVLRDRGLTRGMLDLATSAGARAVVVTVDTPITGTKDGDGPSVWVSTPTGYSHTNVHLAAGSRPVDLTKADDLTPDIIGWLAEVTGLPVVVKGVVRGDDAVRAVDAGAAAVWVSNHGGRQLDQTVSALSALSEVVAAVGDDVEVYVDGGVRRGVDVLIARALGARCAFVGRPALWALTVDGPAGVERLVAELGAELREAMTVAGCPTLADVAADLVVGGSSRE